MLQTCAILFIALVLCRASLDEPLVTKAFVDHLRRVADTSQVQDYEESIFRGWTLADFRETLCGDTSEDLAPTTVADEGEEDQVSDLPTDFDSRSKWPHCVHPIRVQGHCGSCWAFGTTEAMSDRFCIKGKDVILAPQDLVSCDKSNTACNGGSIESAARYFETTGCVSEACFPYVSAQGHVPTCPFGKCPAAGHTWTKYHCQAGSTHVLKTVQEMKQQIYQNGPIVTRFDHYADFNLYKGGVYQHKAGAFVCGHVMKTIGWGKQGSLDYWILANTYGTAWGEKGFVKFKMHDCKIDGFMVSCLPRV